MLCNFYLLAELCKQIIMRMCVRAIDLALCALVRLRACGGRQANEPENNKQKSEMNFRSELQIEWEISLVCIVEDDAVCVFETVGSTLHAARKYVLRWWNWGCEQISGRSCRIVLIIIIDMDRRYYSSVSCGYQNAIRATAAERLLLLPPLPLWVIFVWSILRYIQTMC